MRGGVVLPGVAFLVGLVLGGVAFGVVGLGVVVRGVVVLGGVAFGVVGRGDVFFGAAPPVSFQSLPQPTQVDLRAGLVARHVVHCQSPAGRAGDGRLGVGRDGAAGRGIGARRVDPQMPQAVSFGPLLLSQSAHFQLAEPATPVVPPNGRCSPGVPSRPGRVLPTPVRRG